MKANYDFRARVAWRILDEHDLILINLVLYKHVCIHHGFITLEFGKASLTLLKQDLAIN